VWRRLTRRERVLIVVALILALGAGGYVYVHEPLVKRQAALAEEIDLARQALARAQALAAEVPAREAAVERLRQRLAAAEARLAAPADLPAFLEAAEAAGRRAGVSIEAIRLMEPVDGGAYRRHPLALTVQGSYAGQVAFLEFLEGSGRLVTVDAFEVSRTPGGGYAGSYVVSVVTLAGAGR